ETTTHYFWAQAHDFEPRNAEMTERVFQQIKTAFLEDVSVFTMQQHNIDLDPTAPTVDINADSGGIQARRIVDRLYAEEQAGRMAAAAGAEVRPDLSQGTPGRAHKRVYARLRRAMGANPESRAARAELTALDSGPG